MYESSVLSKNGAQKKGQSVHSGQVYSPFGQAPFHSPLDKGSGKLSAN